MTTTLEAVMRVVSDSLKAGVVPEVVISTHTDFNELATLPALVLFYPELQPYSPNEKNEEQIEKHDDGTTTIRPPNAYKTLQFDIQILSERIIGAGGLLQLQTNFIVWLQKNRTITVEGKVYEVHGDEPAQPPRFGANLSNLKRVDATLQVLGVEIETGDTKTGYTVINPIFDTELI